MTTQIDSRGPQFTAAVTSVVLAAVLLTAPSTFATVLLAAQAALFAVGAGLGIQRTPLAWIFRTVVRPRLSGTPEWEEALERNGWIDNFMVGEEFEDFLIEQNDRVESTLKELGLA